MGSEIMMRVLESGKWRIHNVQVYHLYYYCLLLHASGCCQVFHLATGPLS